MLTPPTTPDPDAPRVLLFGHPKSGKTHLLGALLRASDAHPEVLGGEVIDPTGRLAAVRDAVYGGAGFQDTHTEIAAYPVFLKPAGGGAVREFALYDCDGRAATALLKHPDVLDAPRVTGLVAKAVLDADLIALVVDAGQTDDDLAAKFEDFLFFLEQVHGRRLRERQVGGLPVFVVLARCDTLAKPTDTAATWEAEVRWHLKKVRRQFEEFVDDQLPLEGYGPSYLPFGSVDVEGYATAVRRPPLADEPRPGAEPFGVAELFHDALAFAAAHRDRGRASDRRLRRTVWAVAAAVGIMIAGGVSVALFQPAAADPELPDRVRLYERNEPPAAVRLAEKNVARNKRLLTGYRTDPGFFALPTDLQAFVAGRLREIDDYQAYREKLAALTPPADARTLDELDRIRTRLTADLALPAEYTWGDTEAAKLRDRWLAEVEQVRGAEAAWYDWYRGLLNQATALTLTPRFDGDWRPRVAGLVEQAGNPPAPPAGEDAAHRTAREFDRVYQARTDWEHARDRLLRLRDLADALGLTPPGGASARPLVIAAPAPDPAEKLAELRKQYPTLETGHEWELANFPEPARGALAAGVREAFGNGARAVRQLIRDRLNPADTPDGWARVADGLSSAPFPEWGRLLHVLARLENPAAPNPVEELAAFLRTPAFTLDLRGADAAVPLALRVPPVIPTGPLTLTVTPRAGGEPATRTYPAVGEPAVRDLATVYKFGPAPPVTVRPGDGLRAELPVRSGEQRFTLAWEPAGSRAFPFDAFAREPRLVRPGLSPEPATGVTLTPAAGSAVPRVPVLLPQ